MIHHSIVLSVGTRGGVDPTVMNGGFLIFGFYFIIRHTLWDLMMIMIITFIMIMLSPIDSILFPVFHGNPFSRESWARNLAGLRSRQRTLSPLYTEA